MTETLILSLIVIVAYDIGATTGFGGSIIALTIAVHLFPQSDMIAVAAPPPATRAAFRPRKRHRRPETGTMPKSIADLGY